MRALGVVLFELVTGELPPSGAGSLDARKILDALWPSMADFVAGLLAEDPALRPSAAESAKILGDFWSEIPDASMVAEMALMVRNFSGFVAESNAAHTPPPLPVEPAREEAEPAGLPPVLSIPPIVPHAPSASGSFFAAGDGPTRSMPSGSYASTLFLAVPTDASIPNFAEESPAADVPPDATLFQGASADPATEEALAIELSALVGPEPRTANALPPTMAESLGGQTTVDPVPIPEIAEWGAQALAALGDQAGVVISPLAPAPESASASTVSDEALPPAVSDPVIEEAFAFLPPPPAEIRPAPARNTSSAGVASPSKQTLLLSSAHLPLEDDLIDEQHDPHALMANAFEAPVASPDIPLEKSSVATDGLRLEEKAGTGQVLEATAFVAEEDPGAAEWVPPRLAHAMATPEADQIRGPRTRTARRSGADTAARDPDDQGLGVAPSRPRRVAIIIAIVAGLAGAVTAAVLTVGPVGKKSRQPALAGQNVPPAKAVAAPLPYAALPAQAVAVAFSPPAAPPAQAVAVVAGVSPPAAVAPMAGSGKKAASSSTVSLPIVSKPDGAMVWIDGEERGKTPCTVKLTPGSARLALVRAGHLTSQLTIEVSEGAKIDAILKPVEPPTTGEARFRAECKTQGKLPVVVDGKETGILCPYSKMRVEPGTHTIGVLVPATGKVHDKEITLSAGVRSINFGD
jgi:hypothetical protein